MNIEIQIGNSHLLFFIVSVSIILALGIAAAYNPSGSGGTPSIMGHSVDEINWNQRIPYLNVSGRVGIGTNTPTASLEVAGQIKITGGSPSAGKVLTSDAAGLATWQTPPPSTNYWAASGNNLYNLTANVGIGTTSPAGRFVVDEVSQTTYKGLLSFSGTILTLKEQNAANSQYPYIEWRNASNVRGAYLGWGSAGSRIDFALENGNKLAITGGNVGIGTMTPGTNKLEVVGGPIKATGGLIIETRIGSDPESPATGQIWLRTDI